jgi:hypothetical protein
MNLPSNSDGKSNLWLGFDEEVAGSLGFSLGVDESEISSLVLVEVFLGISLGSSSSGSSVSLGLSSSLLDGIGEFLVSSLFLKNVLWDNLDSTSG